MNIIAGVLRKTRYEVRFLVENKLLHMLKKGLAKNIIDTYELLKIWKVPYSQNIFGWLLLEKIAKDFYCKR